jgi:NADH-quinone oxidoreductase subunit G
VEENQKYLLQAFMTRHPLDCPICDKAGECDLQNYGAIYGPQRQVVPVSALEKEREEHDWESDFLEYYSNRCVVCYRCTRACDEIVGAHALYVENRGFDSNIVPTVRPMDTSTCEMCGICVHVCPVGAIISKPFKYWSRSWLLQKELTRCSFCPVGCEVQIEYGVGDWRSKDKVYRTKPTEELNICAKAFFGYDVLNKDRLYEPVAQGKKESPGNVVNLLSSLLSDPSNSVAFVLSGYLPLEVVKSVKEIARRVSGVITMPQSSDFFKIAGASGWEEPLNLDKVGEYDFYVIWGDDLTSTAPVLSYYIKGRVYRIGDEGTRDRKLNPQVIELKDVEKLEGKGLLIVTAHSFGGDEAEQVGKRLKALRRKGFDILLVPRESGLFGIYREIRDSLSDIEAVIEEVKKGKINTIVIFGEDLREYLGEKELEELLSKPSHLIAVSPFSDGLS